MRNFKRVLSLALAALMVIGGLVIAPVDAKADGTYTKVEAGTAITTGNYVVIGQKADGVYYAMSNVTTGDHRGAIPVTIGADGSLSKSGDNEIPVWTITATGTDVTFSVGDSYAYYTGSSNKLFMTTESTYSAEGVFTVTDNADGTFTFANKVTPARILQFNKNNNQERFACYTSTQVSKLLLYKYSGTVDVKEDITLDADATPAEIVDAAYQAMADGVALTGTHELKGVIIEKGNYNTNYSSITVTIQIGDMEDKPIQCYNMIGATGVDVSGLKIGDTITVEGTLSYYNNKVQFSQNSQCKEIEPGEVPDTLEQTATDAEIVNKVYELAATNTPMIGEYTLEGVVTNVKEYNTQYGNGTFTIQVGDMDDKLITCYRVSGATGVDISGIKEGDKVEVRGEFGYYNGAPQYVQGSTVLSLTPVDDIIDEEGDFSTAGVVIVLFLGAALVAVSVIGKRKMA